MICPKCGKVLVPGEICDCQMNNVFARDLELKAEEAERARKEAELQAQKEAERAERLEKAENEARKAKNNTADASINVVQAISEIIKDPYNGIADFAEDASMVSSLILLVLNAIFSGVLFATIFGTSLYSKVGIGLGIVNRFSAGFMAFIVCLIAELINVFAVWLVSRLNNTTLPMGQALALSSTKYSLCIPMLLISVIMMAFNWMLGILGFIICVVVAISFENMGMSLIAENTNKQMYNTILVGAITAVAYIAGFFMVIRMLF